MGAYSPATIISKELEKIINRIIKPTLKALKKKKSIQWISLCRINDKKNEPYLIEYNIRMGDPECQVILPRLKTDIVKIFKSSISNNLRNISIKWKKEKSMTIVLCTKGYPGKYKKNLLIKNIERIKLSTKDFIYHAGTQFINNKLKSIGGRVLNITSTGSNFSKIRNKIISIIKRLDWRHGFYRKDIGWKVIKKK